MIRHCLFSLTFDNIFHNIPHIVNFHHFLVGNKIGQFLDARKQFPNIVPNIFSLPKFQSKSKYYKSLNEQFKGDHSWRNQVCFATVYYPLFKLILLCTIRRTVVGYHTQAHEMKHAMLVLHHHNIVNKDMEFIRLNNQNF